MFRLHTGVSFALVIVLATSLPASAAVIGGGGGGTPFDYQNPPAVQGGTFNGTPPLPQGFPNGFSVSGDFSFTAGGGTATIAYTVVDPISIGSNPGELAPGTYALFSGIDGTFSTTATGHQVLLTEFSSTAFTEGIPGSTVNLGAPPHGGLPVLLPLSGGTPLTETDFGSSAPFYLSAGTANLEMSVMASFSGLQSGDVVSVDFPNGGNFSPAPEPASMVLFGLGAAGIAAFRFRRPRVLAN